MEMRLIYRIFLGSPHRLSVRILGFHPSERGSIPLGDTITKGDFYEKEVVFFFICDYFLVSIA